MAEKIRLGGIGVILALGLSACESARQFGPTYFIDTDESQYEADDRDFPRLGTYGDIPEKQEPLPASNVVRFVKNFSEIVDQPSLIWKLEVNTEPTEEDKFLAEGSLEGNEQLKSLDVGEAVGVEGDDDEDGGTIATSLMEAARSENLAIPEEE